MEMHFEKDVDLLTVSFEGEIGEEARFKPVEGIKTILLDLDKVTFLNSCGLRSWILWIKEVPRDILKIFKKCPPMVVEQMSVLDGFVPQNSIIESFYIPYYCEDCDVDAKYLALRGEDFVGASVDSESEVALRDNMICPDCNKEMDLDILPQKYFKFLRYRK